VEEVGRPLVIMPWVALAWGTKSGSTSNFRWAWKQTPAGGTLLSSPALSGPSVDWQPVGTANPATLPATGSAQYFRVQVP
jgi:hypothetical protein